MKLQTLPTNQQSNATVLDFTPLDPNKDFKILYVFPNLMQEDIPLDKYPHVGIMVISACAKQIGCDSHLCDMTGVPPHWWQDVFRGKLKSYKPDLVAFTATSMEWRNTCELVDICRQQGIPHVVGGVHVSDHPEEAIEHADVIVMGEGEGPFLDIIRALSQGQPLDGIPNTWVRCSNGDIVKTPKRYLIEDLDVLPDPDWKLFHEMHFKPRIYRRRGEPRDATTMLRATLEGSRGCPYRCTYCSSPAHMDSYAGLGKWRREKSPERIVAELKAFRDTMGGLEHVHFVDEIFMTGRKRVDTFSEVYGRELAIPFSFLDRPEHINEDNIPKMAKAGMSGISIGLESGDPELRQAVLNRKTKLHVLQRAFDIPRNSGLDTLAFVMIGLPGQDEQSLHETWKFIRLIKPSIAQFTVFRPLKGTVLYEECIERGLYDTVYDTLPWRPQPVLKHDKLDDGTIIRYYALLMTFAAKTSWTSAWAYYYGRRNNERARRVIDINRRWIENRRNGFGWFRNLCDVTMSQILGPKVPQVNQRNVEQLWAFLVGKPQLNDNAAHECSPP